MAKTLLEMKNITKVFPGVKALDNVNLVVEEGEVHAIVGENGAGKSTLMNVLSGIYPYGTYEGDIIYDTTLSANGVIIMGNEGNGISKEVGKTVNRKLFIPAWPAGAATSESLNVAIATAIVCSEFRRRLIRG